MSYIIEYYSQEVEQQISELPSGFAARYIVLTSRMRLMGSDLGMPHTDAMSDGLFELRLKSREGISRVFYCTLVGKRIVMLHSIIKKTQKTPKKDLDLARKRMKEVKQNEE